MLNSTQYRSSWSSIPTCPTGGRRGGNGWSGKTAPRWTIRRTRKCSLWRLWEGSCETQPRCKLLSWDFLTTWRAQPFAILEGDQAYHQEEHQWRKPEAIGNIHSLIQSTREGIAHSSDDQKTDGHWLRSLYQSRKDMPPRNSAFWSTYLVNL